MENKSYQDLISYISYFENDKIKFCTWEGGEQVDEKTFTMAYPKYDEGVNQFVQAVYDCDIMMKDYLPYLESRFGAGSNIKGVIETADFEALKAILTYYIRQERFCDGLWEEAVNEGIFLAILRRLKELLEKEV